MVRFYTLPPEGISWNYLLVNSNNYKILFKLKWKHAILDCGVERFLKNPNMKDYPKSFLEYWKYKAKELTEIFGEKLWITIPDYPDDYHPGQFGDNVSKTIENIKDFIKIEGVNWLVSIQSRYLDRFSFIESCQKVKEIVGEDYPRIAIGTVCKTKNLSFIEYCCKVTRKFFPKSQIHAFGLTLKTLPRVAKVISSWDSLVADRGGMECWRKNQDINFYSSIYQFTQFYQSYSDYLANKHKSFMYYIDRINEILNKQRLLLEQ
jgi:hypothetical protein